MEHIKANDANQHARIEHELQTYRDADAAYVAQMHPHLRFVHLSDLLETYSSLINRTLFLQAMEMLSQCLQSYSTEYSLLDPQRVWIGVEANGNRDLYFGGFYHSNQGYRYLQQIAVFSLFGSLCGCPVDRTLITLELIRSYVHDTLHYNTYRLFVTLGEEQRVPGGSSFYRAQYGINLRLSDGTSFSAKDSVRSRTTRNLGTIMEGATDHLAHYLVSQLVQQIAYNPHESHTHDRFQVLPISDYIYRDCMGQLTSIDILFFRELEQGKQSLPPCEHVENFKIYLKNMRLFVQYVNWRYQQFLNDFDPQNVHQLHETILACMLSGDIERLQNRFNMILQRADGFTSLFQTPAYLSPDTE